MTRIVVVGVGALGSHLVLLARNVSAKFVIVDDDRIEKKNTLSQFHTAMSVGKSKADALKQAMQGLFGLKLEAIPHRLTADNVGKLLGGADLVVDCLDNAASRRVIQDFVRARGIPCLHGALAPNGSFGRSIWDEHFVIDDEAGMGVATCEDGEHLPFIALVSGYLATSVQRFVRDGRKVGFQVHANGVMAI